MTLGVKVDGYERVTASVACSAIAFSMWDTLIHLDQEVQYIWQRPNGWVKWVYLVIRHMPYLAQGSIMTIYATPPLNWSSAQCKFWLAYQATVNEVLTFAVEIVLIMRIIAVFHRNRTVTTAVCTLFVAEIAAMCAILAVTIPKFEFSSRCLVTSAPALFPSYWVISLAFETTLFALTLVKFFTVVVLRQLGGQSIMLTLTKDGTWAYAMLFAVMLLNTLMYMLEKNSLAGICYMWELSVMSFAGSHVLLNIRKLSVHPNEGSLSMGPDADYDASRASPSDLRFVEAAEDDTVVEMSTILYIT